MGFGVGDVPHRRVTAYNREYLALGTPSEWHSAQRQSLQNNSGMIFIPEMFPVFDDIGSNISDYRPAQGGVLVS